MKIEESCVRLDARHDYEHRQSSATTSEFSFRSVLQKAVPPASLAARAETDDEKSQLRIRQMLQQLVETMLEMLSGQKCRRSAEQLTALTEPPAVEKPQRTRIIEWQSSRRDTLEEHEKTEVNGQGEVRTADGRKIDFALSLKLCRDYSCTTETTESERIELKDPLVINFAGQAAELSKQRFSFDLDADGSAELLPKLANGAGYLAFDADHDGRIKDGSELFGATGQHAGDGFADLARLDNDKNGWIDEADPAWAALGVWFPDGQIKPLKEAGIGAVSLASTHSPFELKDDNNATLGQVWRTGVYLNENGSAGTVQQIDLAVGKPPAG